MIGGKIKQARKNKGLSQVELAKLADITQASLSRIEKGIGEPMKKTAIALARALGDDFGESWLTEYVDSSDPPPPSKKEIADEMTVKEFISLKFGGGNETRTSREAATLAEMLDREVERIKREGY